jgi:EAL domain-containing protein (putative c-di-GMP-specific phosphodiesterase class I)
LFCSASIGIALSNAGYQAAEEIVRDADTAMYMAKSRGKAQWAVFDGAMRQRIIQRLQMEHDLRKAMELGQFAVQYQPKIQLHSGELCGFEALVRWNHPERGLLMPEEFIPLAEETGLISAIGLWVLGEACRQTRRWQLAHPGRRAVEISVNVSARQFRQANFVDEVARVLEESGLRPDSLQLEITETVLLDDLKTAVTTLKRLKALGVGLKVDDFGTGYSCLRYLCKLPFDSLKIDRSFTENLAGDSGKSSEVVKTILVMAHNLGMEVVAEGVEDAEQARQLEKLGCEFAQGFYFSKPLSAAEAGNLLAQSASRQNLS